MARKKKGLVVKASDTTTSKKATTRAKRSTKGGDATITAKAETKPRKFQGVKSGMKVMEYQDHTLAINHKTDRRLSDVGLADDWADEFPQSDCLQKRRTSIVKGVRRLYNKGTHRSGQGVPSRLSVPYDDEGKPVEGRQRQSKKAAEKAA
jgi:hypothetical protein